MEPEIRVRFPVATPEMKNKNSNLFLEERPMLEDFQRYVAELAQERGFSDVSVVQNCLLLGEEVGELFKAVRKSESMKTDGDSKSARIDEELADTFIFICHIANQCNVDLERAFREKEEKNKNREWK